MAAIKAKLADPAATKDTDPADLAALTEFYASRDGPLWVTEMGFSAKGQQVLFEIEKADAWGLDPASFTLPRSDALTATPEAQAEAEIALDLAILKYARYARGGRFTPIEGQRPVRSGAAVTRSQGRARGDCFGRGAGRLPALAPSQARAVHALARGAAESARRERGGGKPAADGKDIKRILINMERWRWMPEELGSTYVLQNSAAFMLYVVKDNKTIYTDKTLVGTIGYATPDLHLADDDHRVQSRLERARNGGEGEHPAGVAEQEISRS